MDIIYPVSIFCIIATEFCERFSFCGLRTILSLYLRNELLVPEHTATIIYHVFVMLCYLVPLLGASIADGFLGRYRTILYFSLIYLMGNSLTCFATLPPLHLSPFLFTMFGLLLIAIGTGGIKPCVAAFGGDQFQLPEQEDRLQGFFSIFYFAINTGGLVGMFITPTIRKNIQCFGNDTCYALGFGLPAILMLIGICIFVFGKPWYRMKTPKGNILFKFISCTTHALRNRAKTHKLNRTKQHWLDYADTKCDPKLINDMKIMYAIMLLYIPLPLFWSLFDQQGSRWTFQAAHTNGDIVFCTGWTIQLLPDQMQVVNPAMVLIMIPVLERLVYPKCSNLLSNPLNRMFIGGLAAGAAFLASGLLELQLQKTYPDLPEPGTAAVNVINTLHCPVIVKLNNMSQILLEPHEMRFIHNVLAGRNSTQYTCSVSAPKFCAENALRHAFCHIRAAVQEQQVDTILVGLRDEGDVFLYVTEPVDYSKSLSGKPRIRIAYMHGANDLKNVSITIKTDKISGFQDVFFTADSPGNFFSLSQYMELSGGSYQYEIKSENNYIDIKGTVQLEQGGVYTLVIREYRDNIAFTELYTLSSPNTISMLWLLPQYFLISVGEIMFSISGLEFSFTQAPKSMKAIIIAAWYLTVAVGNLLVILITQAKLFRKQAYEFFMFTLLIFIDMFIFWYIALGYEPVPLEPDGSSFYPQQETEPLISEVRSRDSSETTTVSYKTIAAI